MIVKVGGSKKILDRLLCPRMEMLLCNLCNANLKLTSLNPTITIHYSIQVPVAKLYFFHLALQLLVRDKKSAWFSVVSYMYHCVRTNYAGSDCLTV